MKKILAKSFFERPTEIVGRELLGKFLVVKNENGETARMITEVEIYDGFEDRASHASRGLTERNKPMFGEARCWYVYLVYGMYWMLNVVVGKNNFPAAVLIRGVEGISGPGKVSKFFGVDKKKNGVEICPKNGLWLEDRGEKIKLEEIKKKKRIGVEYAGKEWANKKYNFSIGG